MKKLLLILLTIFLMSGICSFGQDNSPLPSITVKKLIAPNTPVFYYNTADSAFWVFKGETGWLRLATNDQLIKYYVPYDGANDTIDLNTQLITSKKQLLPLFNGACVIPTILDNGDGSITVGDGEYHLSSRADGKGTESYIITGGTFSLTDNTTNYLVADYNGGSPILHVITDVNLINETTIVPIYTAYRTGVVLHFQNWDALGVALANKVHQSIVKTQRYRRESGLGISEVATRYLSIGNGRVWVGAVPVSVDAIITSSDNLRLYYHSGGVWTSIVQSQYNNTQYDNGTNLVTLTANRYAVNWLFRGIESQKHLYVVLGRGDYTLAQAQEAVLPAIPTAISSHAMLIGKLIVQNGATTATSIQSAFDTQFSTATPNAHNDLTSRDVSDVHPAGSITVTPSGTISSTTVAAALTELDAEKEPLLTKGNLNENITGLEFSSTRQVIGGSTTLTMTSGYQIPTTTQVGNIHALDADKQTISGSGTTLSGYQISLDRSGGTVTLPNEADGSTTNEIQGITRVGDTIGLTQTTTTIDISDKQSQLNGTGFVKASGTTISYDNSTYEPAFSKNTAFNKNFGTTAGTVLEGRTFGTAANNNTGDFAPASGSGNYIQNQSSSAQSANMWISGSTTANINQTYAKSVIGYNGDGTGFLELYRQTSTIPDATMNSSTLGYDFTLGATVLSQNYEGNISRFLFNNNGSIQATTAKLTNLTDGYIPYHISDALGLGNSPIYTDGTNVGYGGDIIYRHTFYMPSSGHGAVFRSFGNTNNPGLFIETNESSRVVSLNASGSTTAILKLQTVNNDALVIDEFQRVGIGYSTGTEIDNNKLAVNGSAYFNTSLRVNGLSGSNTRLIVSTSDGTLTNIANGTGFLKNDGSGNFSYSNISTQQFTGGNISHNASSGINALVVLTSNCSVYTLSNVNDGEQGDILVFQNSTGGYGINSIVQSGLTTVYPDINNDDVGDPPNAANINSGANRKSTISFHRVNNYLLITYGNYAY